MDRPVCRQFSRQQVLENLFGQVTMAMRALDAYKQDHQPGTVPQMQDSADVKAQMRMYEDMQRVLKSMRIDPAMYMLRPEIYQLMKSGDS